MREPVRRSSLVAVAQSLGRTDIDERAIEHLSRQGALPHARRVRDVNGGWSYPALAPYQLERYLELRAQGLRLKGARFVLWVDGYDVEPEWASRSLVEYLEKATEGWGREVEQHASPEVFVGAIADTFTAARARSPLPRLVRQSQAERRQAYECLAGVMVGVGNSDPLAAQAFERAIGRRDRHGELYPEFAEDTAFLSELDGTFDFPSQLAAARSASAAELELARRAVHFQVVYGPLLFKAFAWELKSAAPFFQLAQAFPIEEPRFMLGLVAATLGRLARQRANAGYESELAQHRDALEPGRIGLELLDELPVERRAFLSALPMLDRALIARELRRRQRARTS